MLYEKVWWEPLRKTGVFQCKNCQRIGHSSTNCHLGYRCVKSKESHKPGECIVPKENSDRTILFCVNCQSFGHPASYKGCPFYKLANDIKKARTHLAQNKRRRNVNEISQQINNTRHRPAYENATYQNNSNNMYPPLKNTTQDNNYNRIGPAPRENQWNNFNNNSSHLFPPQDNKEDFFAKMLCETKTQIISSISEQLIEMQKTLSLYMYKVDILYTHLGLNNGQHQ